MFQIWKKETTKPVCETGFPCWTLNTCVWSISCSPLQAVWFCCAVSDDAAQCDQTLFLYSVSRCVSKNDSFMEKLIFFCDFIQNFHLSDLFHIKTFFCLNLDDLWLIPHEKFKIQYRKITEYCSKVVYFSSESENSWCLIYKVLKRALITTMGATTD